MLIHKGFLYRIYPNAQHVERLEQWNNALRFLWNLALEQRLLGLARPKGERRFPTAFDQINELTPVRAELPWLADVPRDVCAQLLIELDKAWQRCFQKLARAPRWKRKGRDVLSFCEPHPKMWRLDGTTLRFPKLGNMRAVVDRPIEGKPKTCTLTRDGDQWFASIMCEVEIADPIIRTAPAVALDRGIAVLAATSNGEFIENHRYLERTSKRLARAQRTVARRKKGSNNREKAKLRVMRLHRKVRRQREHRLHQITTALSKSHAIVVVEKLQIGNMIKTNRGLARSILDAGWGRMVQMLRYKLAWSGGTLVEVPAAYSSQTCSACGVVDPKSRRSQAAFGCTACGHAQNADVNAARVLKKRFETPGNPWCLPVEGSAYKGPQRSRKSLRAVKSA